MDWGKAMRGPPKALNREPGVNPYLARAAQPPPPATPSYEAFCAQCEGCLHFDPCGHAMNTTMACTGSHQHEVRA